MINIILLLSTVWSVGKCEIEDNGVWTGFDWTDATNNIQVINGVPSDMGNNADQANLIQRAHFAEMSYPVALHVSSSANVQMIQNFLTSSLWDTFFPLADPFYTFDDFMRAVAHFPSFCGSDGDDTSRSHYMICIDEIVTLFAHIAYETNCNDLTSTTASY